MAKLTNWRLRVNHCLLFLFLFPMTLAQSTRSPADELIGQGVPIIVPPGGGDETNHGDASDFTSSGDTSSGDNRHLWKPRTRSVAVFKNGLAFFTQEASANLRDGWCHSAEIPPAAFGTLAIYALSPDHVVDIVGSGPGEIIEFDGLDQPLDRETKRKYLESSRHLNVEIQYRQKGAERHATGQLASVDEHFAILEQDQQTLAIPISGITRLQLLNVPLRLHVSHVSPDVSAVSQDISRGSQDVSRGSRDNLGEAQSGTSDKEPVESAGAPESPDAAQEDREPPSEAKLGMAYLRKGMMWIPEYTLQILDDETAELTLRGTLINEAEDLVNCDVQFVVGVPHFAHNDLLSPIAVGRTLRAIGSGIPRQDVPPQVMTQMMNRAAVANYNGISQFSNSSLEIESDGGTDLSDLLNQLPALESAAASDYTVYTKSGLTVRRGERASVTLFTQKVRYRHRYRWETTGPIKHLLMLENRSRTPWTTGPCLALSGILPLSEDVLKYTPAGGSGELPVTTAINLSHSVNEEEIDRELKAHSPRNNEFYDLVKVRGSIRLRSFEAAPVEVEVSLPVEGRPTKGDDEAVIRMDATRLRLLDRAGTISWNVTLAPREEKTLHYEYERYVPSH
jgi:hypothetical protein